jgi:hypothetical protein
MPITIPVEQDQAMDLIDQLRPSERPAIVNRNREILWELGVKVPARTEIEEINSMIDIIKTGLPELQKVLDDLKFYVPSAAD